MTISILKKVNFLSLTSTITLTLYTVGVFTAFNIDNRAKAVVVAGDPDNYIVKPGTGYDGVVQLILNKSGIVGSCTGSLLPTGLHILTAAHCLTQTTQDLDVGGIPGKFVTNNVAVLFESPLLPPEQRDVKIASEFYINPYWNGDFNQGNDLAIIKLADPAPQEADRYDIYRNQDEFGQVFTMVGYGASGNGNTGATIPAGTKHYGQNIYEFTYPPDTNRILSYLFENGLEPNETLASSGFSRNKGLGLNEGITAQGDSGGPNFINGLIASITSFGSTDYTYGAYGSDTRVSSYASYIDDVLADKIKPTYKIPEPSTVFGSMLALGAFAINSRFRRKAKEQATK